MVMTTRRDMRRITVAAGMLLSVAALAGTGGDARAEGVSLTISCGAIGVELSLCRDGVAAWEKTTGNTVDIVSTPNSSNERFALYQQILGAGADDIDVLQIDVVWPGMLAPHLVDLSEYMGDAPAQHFPALIENDTVDGRLVAMPWWTDAGVLYYRKDLLDRYGHQPPESWSDLTRIAADIQQKERAAGQADLWGYVWQGRAYEGLTCNALEWIDAYGGGTIVDADGRVTVNNPKALAALTEAASWVGTISPEGVLTYDEEAARGVFQSGKAVFMRNWPYAWALAQSADSPVKDKVGVTALPPGAPEGKTTGTLGGWHLAVSRYSKHPAEAADLVRFLTGAAEQKRRAVEAAYNPTIPALYKDDEVLAANPFFGQLYQTFETAVARPSRATGDAYNRLSAAVWQRTQDALAGRMTPEAALTRLDRDLGRLSRGGRW
ncbi:ABC transporter substrate-binding protein [Tistrella mobilis]|uniref:ABC transporter-binding protein n=1 Tax=Tistrella mobilis (strain KA081020-065) TaxID=1110502 RepID=I3TWJ2_TISMK|nr:putative ABC transporter-binding protein [Tistrella mobilis KA081020-065]